MMKRSIAVRALAAVIVAILCLDMALRPEVAGTAYRAILYSVLALAGLAGVLMLIRLRQDFEVSRRPVQIQVLIDVAMVSALVYFTGGASSLLALVYIIVVLEAGILLSRFDGLMVATISSLVMLVMHVIGYDQTEYFGISLPGAPAAARVPYDGSAIGLWLDLVVYVFAFYLTAFISGYWSFKFRRMLDFQRSLLNYLNSGFLIVDKDGFIRTFNDAAQSMLGYSLPAAMNRPVNEIMRTVDGSDNPVEQTLRTGAELTSHEFTGRRHDGSPLPLGITTSVIRDRFDRTEGVIASFADMTDLDRVRRELRRQDRLAAIGRLAAGLAHEIRNPVASIRGAIEELKNSMDDPVTMQTLADIAIRESDQLNAIVTGFLDYARGAPRDIGPLDLRDALEEVIVLLRRDEDSNHNIELTVEQEDNLVVDGDHSQLKQAFMNIGKNAMEAMLDGGTLSVVAENDADRTVTVTFSDTGEGMNDEDLSTVFEPFFTTKPHGVGMGLAVVHRIVTSHNGTVLIDSTPGKGTSVRMTFPSHSVDDIRLQTEFCGEVNQNATPASSRS